MEDKEESLVEIHLYAGKDLPQGYKDVVRARWTRSYRRDNDYMRLVQRDAYYCAYNVYVERLLNRQSVDVRLAVLQEDSDVVMGFSVMEGTMLHYVHVPKDYRRNGIGTQLVPMPVEWISHITKIGFRLWSTHAPDAKFNPFHT